MREPIDRGSAPRAHTQPTATESLEEQPLDTEVPEPPPPPPRKPVPPKPVLRPNGHRPVRTPRDEDLPSWCPVSGRLTVVESCDLAENLGLAPMGTARDGGCPSVAALLEEERIRRNSR